MTDNDLSREQAKGRDGQFRHQPEETAEDKRPDAVSAGASPAGDEDAGSDTGLSEGGMATVKAECCRRLDRSINREFPAATERIAVNVLATPGVREHIAQRLAEDMDTGPQVPQQHLCLRRWMKSAPRWLKPAVAATAVLVLGGLALAGVALRDKYVRDLQEITRLRQEATKSQAQYDQAWSALRFEELVKPVVRVLPAESGGQPDRIRLELSPRVEEGLIREVSVSWGDAGDVWDLVYDALGAAKGFQVVHQYTLPPAGQTRQWTLRVLYTVPDAVASARRLGPDQLTSICRVEATVDGIRLLAETGLKGPAPELGAPGDHQVAWLSPLSGSEVGWKVKVTLLSPAATELVTLLVRPVSGNTFYVQPGARRLPAGTPESFDIQLGSGSESAIGADFDILAVCGGNFAPDRWVLDLSQVPHSAVISRVTLRKAAGTIHRVQGKVTAPTDIGIDGEIWTTHGGALLMKEGDQYRVLKTFSPAADGNRFAESTLLLRGDHQAVYLLVYRDGEPVLQAGQTVSSLPTESWLYGCSNTQDEVQRKPLEQGAEK